MRFVVDAQLSPRLVDWLRHKGHDAEHVGDGVGLLATDQEIALHALGGVIVSKDSDFLTLLDALAEAPQLLWVRLGNCTNDEVLARLEADWTRIQHELANGAAVVEV